MFIIRDSSSILTRLISTESVLIVNFPAWIPECNTLPLLIWINVQLLDLVCSAVTYPTSENSDHVVAFVSTIFHSNSKEDANFHFTAFDPYCADWDSFRNDIRYVFTGASAAISEFCKRVHVKNDVYLFH